MKRSEKGATLGLVAASGSVLVLIVLATVTITLLLGGNQELRNAADAGALNLGKQIFNSENFKVSRPASQFQDVADKHGKFGLANINAVWGRALLCQANAEAMQAEGLAGNAKQNADRLFDEASSISDELAAKLNNSENQAQFFESVAQQNSLRMLGASTQLQANHNEGQQEHGKSSLMNRGRASNLQVPASDMFSERSYAALNLQDKYLPGYTPLRVGGRTFCFVPFVDNERTQLVSKSEFDAGLARENPINGPEWRLPVPNAFSCGASCEDKLGIKHTAVSCVLTNPQKKYRISLPHTFVHIRLEDNRAEWLFNAPDPRINGFDIALREKRGGYANRLDLARKSGGGLSALDGELKGNAVPLGQEYTLSPSLDTAIFGSEREDGNRSRLEKALLQRANQMLSSLDKTVSKEELHAVLRGRQAAMAMQQGEHDFYLFSPDGNELSLAPAPVAAQEAPWLMNVMNTEPDGTEAPRYAELSSFLILPPGIVSIDPFPGADIVVPPFGKVNVEIRDSWTPGSGYGGCLGKLVCRHTSKVYLWGIAVLPVAPGGGGLIERVGEFFGF